MRTTGSQEVPIHKLSRLAAIAAVCFPALIADSIVLHDLRITFALSALAVLSFGYLTWMKKLSSVTTVALFVCGLAFAAMALFFGQQLPH